ncbi:MAG: hypothetical protein AAGA44_09890 [Pseudomonadota bacterium]
MRLWYLFVVLLLPAIAFADKAHVLEVRVSCNDERVCRFDVTVEHSDEGWAHYADRWEVLTPDGEIIATRILAHPHDNEQPFTRSLGGVVIPPGITRVQVRARDSVHSYNGREASVELP